VQGVRLVTVALSSYNGWWENKVYVLG